MAWKYLDVLNECIKIIVTIGLGGVAGQLGIVDAASFIPQATKFVFQTALPCLVVQGLGIGINFYSDTILWNFFGAFLALRAIALVVSLVLVRFDRTKGIGDVAVYWLCFTWISTVILGIPISGAVFGNPQLGKTYGILSGASSFIFQLPLQLFFFECHSLQQSRLEEQNKPASEQVGTTEQREQKSDVEEGPTGFEEIKLDGTIKPQDNPETSDCPPPSQELNSISMLKDQRLWFKIVIQVVHNPVLWAIGLGFFLTLSTLGPNFLNPAGDNYIPGLEWIVLTLTWLGDCVSPVSIFAMGVWMQDRRNSLFEIPLWSATLFMVSKLIIVPLIMVFLAKAVNLDDQSGRAAVLIAALPISLASFVLGSRYKIGEALLSENLALGTILILPTILIWNTVLDGLGFYPIPAPNA